MEKEKHIAIVGAGLVGSLLSIYLAKRGYKISVFERRADMRKQALEAGVVQGRGQGARVHQASGRVGTCICMLLPRPNAR